LALEEEKKAILDKYGPYVRSLAVTIRRQFCAQFDLEELISYGNIGLLEAADRFDEKLGANFLTFAHYRIKGAIFDGLRKMGELRGSDVRFVFLNERANAYLGNLSDREQGGGGRYNSYDDDAREFSSAVTGLAALFLAGMYGIEGLQVADEQMTADQKLEFEQLKQRVRGAMDQLPERERKLLQGYYFEGKTLEEAGAEIGQSKSWASRLHARAIEQLKKALSEDGEAPSQQRRKPNAGTHVERARVGADHSTKPARPGTSPPEAGTK
jgi:RNA polymerase sigma factor for flagellar operon FliA